MHGIEMFGEAFDYTIEEKKIPTGKNRRVILENLRGNIASPGPTPPNHRLPGAKPCVPCRGIRLTSESQHST